MRAARERYRQMAPVLDEQSRRRYAAMEALSMGHGGVSAMSRITGLARSTINRGVSDIRNGVMAPPGRVRKAGGGRRRKIDEDPTLLSDLKALVEPSTRGDPMQPLLWTSLSLGKLAGALAEKGDKVSASVVGGLLHGLGYSLQANSKVKEGRQSSGRWAFNHRFSAQ
jgi:transposase